MSNVILTTSSSFSESYEATINGQSMLVVEDPARLSGSPPVSKILSVSESNTIFADNKLSNLDWLAIGKAQAASSGYVPTFQGTITYASYHVANDNGHAQTLDLYINDIFITTIFTMPGSAAESSGVLTNLNIDFNQGEKLQMRGGTTAAGDVNNVTVTLWVKWRV